MKIININIKDLKEYENNPRLNDEAVEFVKNSIKEFGFKVPIIVDKNNVIVAGHTRLKASKLLNLKEVPCIVADDLTPEQIKAFRLADNKTHEMADWDFDLLLGELEELDDDFDMELFGFDFEIDDDDIVVVDDDYDVVVPEEPKSKLGDVYQLGRHRLLCGDATNPDDLKTLMDGKLADLFLTDPPYNRSEE